MFGGGGGMFGGGGGAFGGHGGGGMFGGGVGGGGMLVGGLDLAAGALQQVEEDHAIMLDPTLQTLQNLHKKSNDCLISVVVPTVDTTTLPPTEAADTLRVIAQEAETNGMIAEVVTLLSRLKALNLKAAKKKLALKRAQLYGARFSIESCTRRCQWFPHLLA
jgi:hypothetical protein